MLLDSPTIVDSTGFMHTESLGLPFHLEDSPIPPPISSPRRRSKASSSNSRRRRVSPRASFRIATHKPSFDDLPWISTLEASPELTSPWDIADLSLIPDSPTFESSLSLSGPGPTRRRKSSLRSSPMNSSPSTPTTPLPLRDTSSSSRLSVPTPRSKFLPSRVLFHNLMPVSFNNPL